MLPEYPLGTNSILSQFEHSTLTLSSAELLLADFKFSSKLSIASGHPFFRTSVENTNGIAAIPMQVVEQRAMVVLTFLWHGQNLHLSMLTLNN